MCTFGVHRVGKMSSPVNGWLKIVKNISRCRFVRQHDTRERSCAQKQNAEPAVDTHNNNSKESRTKDILGICLFTFSKADIISLWLRWSVTMFSIVLAKRWRHQIIIWTGRCERKYSDYCTKFVSAFLWLTLLFFPDFQRIRMYRNERNVKIFETQYQCHVMNISHFV